METKLDGTHKDATPGKGNIFRRDPQPEEGNKVIFSLFS